MFHLISKKLILFGLIVASVAVGAFYCNAQFLLGRGQLQLAEAMKGCIWCTVDIYADSGIVNTTDVNAQFIEVGDVKVYAPEGIDLTKCNRETVFLSGKIRRLPWENNIKLRSVEMVVPHGKSGVDACYMVQKKIL